MPTCICHNLYTDQLLCWRKPSAVHICDSVTVLTLFRDACLKASTKIAITSCEHFSFSSSFRITVNEPSLNTVCSWACFLVVRPDSSLYITVLTKIVLFTWFWVITHIHIRCELLLFHLPSSSLYFTREELSPPLVQVRVSNMSQLIRSQKVHLELLHVEDILWFWRKLFQKCFALEHFYSRLHFTWQVHWQMRHWMLLVAHQNF